MNKKKMELLAPAGSFETLRAVIEAGADAVYLGGPAFGARAFANNFTEEELLEAIDYAHLRGVRIFLTVNTLLKNQEINKVPEYLDPFYKRGLDAVLVQDFGVLQVIREHFPDMEVHTSTQMTVTGVEGVRFLQNYGVSRVVMAREMSLAEMKKIHDETGMELEAFVHGALCYCYSGQCLFSSMLGGRSGNRGRCAQPCRLPYAVMDEKQHIYKKESYCISLKDMCGIEDLRALKDAGVYSLKIEGRMKSPDYAAGVVALYRKYLDQLEREGKGKVSKADTGHLSDLGSRCGFTDQYYRKQNGSDMITFEKPNLEYKDPAYHEKILDTYVKKQKKLTVSGRLTLKMDQESMFEVWREDYYVCVQGQVPGQAKNKPLEAGDVSARMQKTGDTSFVFDSLELDMDAGVFLPNGALNKLRREALEELEKSMLAEYLRQIPAEGEVQFEPEEDSRKNGKKDQVPAKKINITSLVETGSQLEVLMDWPYTGVLYADIHLYYGREARFADDLKRAHAKDKKLMLALPQILRERGKKCLLSLLDSPDFPGADGYLVKNYEEFYLIRQKYPDVPIITDHNLYTYNDLAADEFLAAGAVRTTMPLELNAAEIAARNNPDTEMIVYGYYPLMTSAQCVHANTSSCDRKPQLVWMKDRYKTLFPVKNYCDECYNVIYNSVPVYLFGQVDRLRKTGLSTFRLQFSIEDRSKTQMVLEEVEAVLKGGSYGQTPSFGPVTNGHYKRGVE